MSAFAALVAARVAGVSLRVDAGSLAWEAADWRTFYELRYQAALSRDATTLDQAAATALECCVAEWLNQAPAPSEAGRCARCGGGDHPGVPLVPHGIRAEEYTWLHSKCSPDWFAARRQEACGALARVGVAA